MADFTSEIERELQKFSQIAKNLNFEVMPKQLCKGPLWWQN